MGVDGESRVKGEMVVFREYGGEGGLTVVLDFTLPAGVEMRGKGERGGGGRGRRGSSVGLGL